jgi:hypothetical protein
MNQEAQQESLAGGGNTGSTSFATGTTCTVSGTYRTSNKYMDIIAAVAAGEKFGPDATGKRCSWVALTQNLSSNKDGGFTGTKVAPGTI